MIDPTNTGQSDLISPLWKNAFSPQRFCSTGGGVPSLVWLCLQCIAEFPDQVQLHHRLIYQPSQLQLNDIDKFLAFVSTGPCGKISDTHGNQEASQLGPRLWAAIVQVFDYLPLGLRSYTISLNDEALPLLQRIPNTATFSLMTILELPGCVALTDSSISQLKDLHTLTAFDASCTQISSYGLLSLTRTLQRNDPLETTRRLRGPWPLRILRLKHCTWIDDAVYPTLPKFPLLSVVDLRGTSCNPHVATIEFAFSPNADRSLFSSDMAQSLEALQICEKDLQMYSAVKEHQFTLRIKNLCHEAIAKALSQKNDHIGYHLRSSLHQSSRISADDFDFHWTDEDLSDRYSQGSGNDEEESIFDNMEELEELGGGNLSGVKEEELSGTGVNDEVEEQDDLDERAMYATKQWRDLRDRLLDENRSDTDSPLIQQTMASRACPRSKQDHNQSQISCEEFPTMSFLPQNLRSQFPDRQKPHWYDADWTRANTYVPMSLAEGEYDSELMLYRPMRPWKLLESELDARLAKEAHREQVRTDGHSHAPDLIAPSITKKSQVQEDMKLMTAEALRRRQIHNPPAEDEPFKREFRNPFARRPAETPLPVIQNNGQPKGKALKPISALQIPKLTHELLQQALKTGSFLAHHDNKLTQSSTSAKNSPAAKLLMRGSVAHIAKGGLESACSVSADLEEEGSKRKMIRRHQRISMSSGSTVASPAPPTVKRGGGKGGRETQPRNFDWAAWASRKS